MAILRNVEQIAEASTEDLLETYNALKGKSIKKFASREAGKRQVEQAMMAAKDADAHLGVPKGADGEVKTAEELAQKADEKGAEAPDMSGDEQPGPTEGGEAGPAPEGDGTPTFPPGSMADQLQKAGAKSAAITKRAKKAPTPPGSAKPAATHVVAVAEGGKSKVRATSQRGAVLQRIQLSKDKDGAQVPVSIASLDAHFQVATKGYIQKLAEHGHVKFVDAQGELAAAPTGATEAGAGEGSPEGGEAS